MATLTSLLSDLIAGNKKGIYSRGDLGYAVYTPSNTMVIKVGNQDIAASNATGQTIAPGSRVIMTQTDSGYVVTAITDKAKKITKRIQIDG